MKLAEVERKGTKRVGFKEMSSVPSTPKRLQVSFYRFCFEMD